MSPTLPADKKTLTGYVKWNKPVKVTSNCSPKKKVTKGIGWNSGNSLCISYRNLSWLTEYSYLVACDYSGWLSKIKHKKHPTTNRQLRLEGNNLKIPHSDDSNKFFFKEQSHGEAVQKGFSVLMCFEWLSESLFIYLFDCYTVHQSRGHSGSFTAIKISIITINMIAANKQKLKSKQN